MRLIVVNDKFAEERHADDAVGVGEQLRGPVIGASEKPAATGPTGMSPTMKFESSPVRARIREPKVPWV